MEVIIENQLLVLLAEKAIYWPELKTLIIADLHFGKVTHFNKSGINLPVETIIQELKKLTILIERFKPDAIIFLGDFFHHKSNYELSYFESWRKSYLQTEFILVIGNHDKHALKELKQLNFKLIMELLCPPFLFAHAPEKTSKQFRIVGHIHPGVKLLGKANQQLILPAFCLTEKQLLLPAFGNFTGLKVYKPEINERIFVVTGTKVVEVRNT